MSTSIRVLIVEDSATDAEIVVRELRRAGFEPNCQRVDTEQAFLARLHDGLDLVISDYAMPEFSGIRALELLKQSGVEVPFILVSGTIGEETAVAAMKLGASDYLLKDRLTRLGTAVAQALEQNRLRRERTRDLETLRESERRFREMLENVDLIAMILDQNGIVTFCNDHLLRLTGWKREDVVGQPWFDRFLPDSAAAVKPLFFDAFEKGAIPPHHQNPIKTRTGELREIVWNNTMLRDSAGNTVGTASIGEDVTERSQAEAALRESEAQFRQVVENIREVFWMTDPAKGQMLYVSPAYESIWGRTCESLRQAPLNWLEAIHPEDRERIVGAMRTKQARGDYDETYRILRPDGSLRWIQDRAYPLRDANGELFRIVGTAEDITQRRQLEAQFQQAQKMEALGTLAGGIAHDFNNILGAIMGYCELARMSLHDHPVASTYLAPLMQGVHRAIALVRQILAFSRRQEPERRLVQLRKVVAEPLELLRATIPSTIDFEIALQDTLPAVLADATQVHQVVMNLCTNAWHAMRDRPGRLQVSLEAVEVEAALAGRNPKLRPGPYVRLTVTDTGHGMDQATLQRIFEPFFTTKAPGEGTGLGLAAVHGIMQSHGGAILVDSELDQGTRFQLFFPAQSGPAAEFLAAPTEIPRGSGQHVLLIDDEHPLVRLGHAMLVELGYAVTACENPRTALQLVRDNPALFDLVITDLTMPGMTGIDLARELHAIRSGLPVLLCSGLTAGLARDSIPKLVIREVLPKPYSVQQLACAVKRVLGEGSSRWTGAPLTPET